MRVQRLEKIVVLIGIIIVIGMILQAERIRAEPLGPTTFETLGSSRRSDPPAASIEAVAGNVTELRINAVTVTKSWAGYYGNVTGTIVLDDANNNSMYTWDIDYLIGEVYAARKIADFSSANIMCANRTHVEEEETNLSIGSTDKDGVNETFRYKTHPSFYVGTKLFASDSCNYTVSTYVDDAEDPSRTFNETLLYDKSNSQIIYLSLLTNDQDGFKSDNQKYDFQMLVGEDGHDNSDTTTYYFYVELQ